MEKSKDEKCHECGKRLKGKRYIKDKGFHFCSIACAKKGYFERGIVEDPLSP